MLNNAFKFLRLIEDLGYRAYIVGGAVRDTVWGNMIHDVDIATNAPVSSFQEYVTADLSKHKNGFETYQISFNGIKYEVSTIRGNDIYDDLCHRDININAMAYDVNGNLLRIEKYDGIKMCYNDAFIDDPIRIIRAIRFYAQEKYGAIDENTIISMKDAVGLLKEEKYTNRIVSELERGFSDESVQHEKYIHMLFKIGVMRTIFPCVRMNYEYKNVGKYIKLLKPETRIHGFFCCLEHDNKFADTLHKMKYSNDVVNLVRMFDIDLIEQLIKYNDSQLFDFMQNSTNQKFFDIVENMVLILRHDKDDVMYTVSKMVENVIEKGKHYPRYSISGNELMDITGMQSGPELGKLYREINDSLFNTMFPKETAIHYLKKRYKKNDNC